MHVHIKFELPKYGDNILAATSSIIIPRPPAIKVVTSNIYFLIRLPHIFLYFHQKRPFVLMQ